MVVGDQVNFYSDRNGRRLQAVDINAKSSQQKFLLLQILPFAKNRAEISPPPIQNNPLKIGQAQLPNQEDVGS